MNAGVQPRLLQRNQLAFALNATVRQGFIQNRPPFYKQINIAWPSPSVQESVEQGVFQGACYYKPDSGPQALIASISGRLYRFDVQGSAITVSDITIDGDPNPADRSQAWLWQADKWVIVNDGISLPIFYDGSTTRRSRGASVQLASATPQQPTVPDIGSSLLVATAVTYTAGYDFPVLFNGEYYQPIKNDGSYDVSLTNISDNTATQYPKGTQIVIQPSVAAVVGASVEQSTLVVGPELSFEAGTFPLTLEMTYPRSIGIGTVLSIASEPTDSSGRVFNSILSSWRVVGVSGTTLQLTNAFRGSVRTGYRFGYRFSYGTQIKIYGSTAPNIVAGGLTQDTQLGIGSTQDVELDRAYSGKSNQMCFINGREYNITPLTFASGGTLLRLVNLSDASGASYPTAGSPTPTRIALPMLSVPELPAGRMGCYAMGQNWMSLVDGVSFIVSDASRGPSGTQANDYRDAILKVVDLTFGGGAFSIPSSGKYITSIKVMPKLDESLGQGAVQVGTQGGIFSVLAPFDYYNPPDTGNPLLPEIMIGPGPLAQNSTVLVNSDTFFRTFDNYSRLILARRNFTETGNGGISDEVDDRILVNDDEQLLPYGTAVTFDNRWIGSANPQPCTAGVLHGGAVVVNLDPVSGMRDKLPPVYDGLWTGINVLQYVSGQFNNEERLFAFSYNVDLLKMEFYELLPSGQDNRFDNGYVPITWGFETSALFNADIKEENQLIKLANGQITLDNVIGKVRVQSWYRFDNGCWIPWSDFSKCASSSGSPQTFPKLSLGEPSSSDCNGSTGKDSKTGYLLQVKFQITGSCRFVSGRFKAVSVSEPDFGPASCETDGGKCISVTCPDVPQDLTTYGLQTNAQYNESPITVTVPCPTGWRCPTNLTVTYPPGTFVSPNGNFAAQGCQSLIVADSLAQLFAELAQQQAACAAVENPPEGWQPPQNPPWVVPVVGISLGQLSQTTSCVDAEYTATAEAKTQNGPVEFQVLSGSLPTGLQMTQDGNIATISGTATASGYYQFALMATDTAGNVAVKIYGVTVAGIAEDTLSSGSVGAAYSQQLTIDGPTTGAEVWQISSGSLPPGLSLNSSTGEIFGTPTTEGEYQFVICFSNSL